MNFVEQKNGWTDKGEKGLRVIDVQLLREKCLLMCALFSLN